MKKIIKLEDIGIYSKLPNNLNDLLNGEEIRNLMNILSKKSIKLVFYKKKLAIQLGSKILFFADIKIDEKKRKFVVVLNDDNI